MAKPLAGVPVFRWLGNSDIIRQILLADPTAPRPAWSLCPPHVPPPPFDPSTPVANFKSFADFHQTMPPGFRWVLYDPESWDLTPADEQADPWTWLPRFGQYAHAHGYRVICAPARDLGNVKDSVRPRDPGTDLTAWYWHNELAGYAAMHSDIVSIQSQAITEDVKAYESFVTLARADAKQANPYVKVFAGVSTRYGTAAQMAAAARSVHVDGFWLNVPGPSPDVGKAVEFLHLMTGGAT